MFLYEKKWHQSTACIQFSASQEFTLFICIMPLQHHSARCQNWKPPKWSKLDRWVKLLSCSQNGCLHGMPERKQRLIQPFLIFLLWVCMLGWMRQSSAVGLKGWWKQEHSICDSWERRIRALDLGKESSLGYLSIWTLRRAGNTTKLICKIAVGEESKISIGHKPEMSSVLNGTSLNLLMLTVNYF